MNILVAGIGFGRSFMFMKFLKFEELGIIAIVQTASMFLGFFQIGLINGGYRIVARRKTNESKQVNNFIFSYFGSFFLFLTILFFLNLIFKFYEGYLIGAVTIFLGVFQLSFNWLTNSLIGRGNYSLLNRLNLSSAGISILFFPLVYTYGLIGGYFCLLIQPFVFIVLAFIYSKESRPNSFALDKKVFLDLLKYGFIPYLSGVCFLLYMQIERWSITLNLGPTQLGNLYLFFIVTTLWVLIPTSISNIFFPKSVLASENKRFDLLNKNVNNHFVINLAYAIFGGLILILLLNPVVNLIIPKFSPFTPLVILGIPGFVLRILCDPFNIYFNSIVKLRPILFSDFSSLCIYIFIVVVLIVLDKISLNNMIISFNFLFGIKFLILVILYFKNKNKSLKFSSLKIK